MPSNASKENVGRMRSFKNNGKDREVSGEAASTPEVLARPGSRQPSGHRLLTPLLLFPFTGDETEKKRRYSRAKTSESLVHVS